MAATIRPPWLGVLLLLAVTAASEVAKEPELITEPRPGQEYVLVSSRNNTQPAAAPKHDAGVAAGTLPPSHNFKTSHQIPVPVVRKALGGSKPNKALLDPRDDASDGFATSHKITREARAEELPARRLDDKYDGVLEEQEPGQFDTPAPPQHQPGPKLLRLLGGSAPETHLPLVQLNPAILPGVAGVEIRPEGHSGFRGVALPADDGEKKMMNRKAAATSAEEGSTSGALPGGPLPEPAGTAKPVKARQGGRKKVAARPAGGPKVESNANRGVLLGTSTVTEVSVRLDGEDSTHTIQGLQRRADLADLEPLTTTTEQPPTATPSSAVATTTEQEQSGFVYVPVNLPSSSLPKAGAEGITGKQRLQQDDGSFDFVDSPLGDKVLVPAGSAPSQSSRVNVKKGPNGQDYEYEYVYYYYDEDEDDKSTTSPNSNAGSNSVYTPPLVSQTPLKTPPAPAEAAAPVPASRPNYSSPPRFFSPTDAPALAPSPQPELTRTEVVEDFDQDDEVPQRPAAPPAPSRNRYTNIERTTPEPTSNEVLPPQNAVRSRGRAEQAASQAAVQPAQGAIPEERLPANTRFPPRSRAGPATTLPPPTDTPITRVRVQPAQVPGAIRRPSLDLVDATSFRTHPNDQNLPSVPAPVVEEEEDAPAPTPAARTTHTPPRSRLRPQIAGAFAAPEASEAPEQEETVAPTAAPQPTRTRGRGSSRSTTPRPTVREEEDEETPTRPTRPAIRRPTTTTTTSTTTTTTTTTTTPPPPSTELEASSTTELPSTAHTDDAAAHTTASDIGALDLYAILQQTRVDAANTVDSHDEAEATVPASPSPSTFDLPASISVSVVTSSPELHEAPATPEAVGVSAVSEEEVSAATTTPVPTTTTTTAPSTTSTTTTTTTTTETPTSAAVAPGRGRYRARPGGAVSRRPAAATTTAAPAAAPAEQRAPGFRGRYRGGASSTTTTEAPTAGAAEAGEEAPKRSRFGQGRAPGAAAAARPGGAFGGRRGTFGRTTTAKPEGEAPVEETVDKKEATNAEASPGSGEEAPHAAPARRPGAPAAGARNRFRAGPRLPSTTTSAPGTGDQATARPASIAERFNRRRPGARGSLPGQTTTEAAPAAPSEEEEGVTKDEQNHDSSAAETTALPATPATPAAKPTRSRANIGGGARPLRPGPRVNIQPRPRPGQHTTAAPAPAPVEDSAASPAGAPEEAAAAPADSQEAAEQPATPAPDALTRLRQRPRLRVQATPRPAAAGSPGGPRRQPSPLLRRGPGKPASTEAPAAVEEHSAEDSTPNEEAEKAVSSEEGAVADAVTTEAAAEHPPSRLSSLLNRRRPGVAPGGRKPGAPYRPQGPQQASADAADAA